MSSTAAELIAEAREAVAYLDSFDAHRLTGTPEPTVPARLAERLVQQTIADLADALEDATRPVKMVSFEPEPTPRVVSTVAELDALPSFSVIRIQQGKTLEKLSEGWFEACIPEPYKAWPIWLPATVLWVGGTE